MDAVRLTEKLRTELKKLDQQVATYRRGQAHHFLRVVNDTLRDVPDDVHAHVRDSIANSLAEFPAIKPALQLELVAGDSPPPTQATPSSASKGKMPVPRPSTPPPLPSSRPEHEEEEEEDGSAAMAGSSREREAELQGVFTPLYLPLLEEKVQLPPAPPTPLPQSRPAMIADTEEGSSSTASTRATRRPETFRRETDEASISSVLSDCSGSGSKPTRSALRNSPSSSRTPQSPRRVRFEVAGTEVLPTASPSGSALDVRTQGRDQQAEEEDDSLTAAKILGYDDDEPPPPKKISSTERLRAMAKLNPNPDAPWPPLREDELATSSRFKQPLAMSALPPKSTVSEETRVRDLLGTPSPEMPDEEEAAESSEEEFLSMAKPKSFGNKKPIGFPKKAPPPTESPAAASSEPAPRPKEVKESSTSSTKPDPSAEEKTAQSKSAQSDYDDIFGFESESGIPNKPPAPLPADDEGSDEEDFNSTSQEPLHISSFSAARSIPQPQPQSQQSASTTPTTPLSAKLPSAPIVGSYKGKPIMMPIVVDPEVQTQAASLGQFTTFVGGLDGRSGMDEADPSSFHASITRASGFSGTPRSFSERLMMEEMKEREENQEKEGELPREA